MCSIQIVLRTNIKINIADFFLQTGEAADDVSKEESAVQDEEGSIEESTETAADESKEAVEEQVDASEEKTEGEFEKVEDEPSEEAAAAESAEVSAAQEGKIINYQCI